MDAQTAAIDPALATPAALDKNTHHSPIKVLLVDDSKTIRHSARQILEEAGCHITVAEDGFDALCRIAAVRPDIVFMDIMMPGLDGFQACALIRASPEFGTTPVVLVSANDGLLDRARAELAGARRYILKPFRKNDLLGAITALVSRSVCKDKEDKEQASGAHPGD
ncbi:MAG: response regulator [Gammaproteobacteria bacterium]|nr:response regulator [Gammaproteobacteria bacterium]MDP2141076.1 response regulator [Gammaproteobacteria bacterium]MDP2348534.1 response regulator [Gammaproteobacteria bacterium]